MRLLGGLYILSKLLDIKWSPKLFRMVLGRMPAVGRKDWEECLSEISSLAASQQSSSILILTVPVIPVNDCSCE